MVGSIHGKSRAYEKANYIRIKELLTSLPDTLITIDAIQKKLPIPICRGTIEKYLRILQKTHKAKIVKMGDDWAVSTGIFREKIC